MTRVVVVDDQTLIRSAVIEILKTHPETEVVGEASNGREALSVVSELLPDVVLMDIRMPELDGIEATRTISSDPALKDTRILILTTFEDEDHIVAALRAGASGFLGKGAEPDEIVRAVLAVHAGESLLSPAATRMLLTKYVLGTPSRKALVPAGLNGSRNASARSWLSWLKACRIRRLPTSWSSPHIQPRRTSTGR